MKLIITVEIDDTEPNQDAHLDELTIVMDDDELVHIRTNGGEIPARILSVKEG
jgi:hypothetical protein